MHSHKKFVCEFCGGTFVRESSYLKHKCEKMKRYELFSTTRGHTALLIFNQWRKMKNYPTISAETFITSKYFNAFDKFAQFCRSRMIPDKIGYVEHMIRLNMQPFLWCDNDVYDHYMEYFDNEYSIEDKIQISVDTLYEESERMKCDVSEIFKYLSAIDILKMITSRRLSPWLLLTSEKFMDFVKYKTNSEEKILFNTFIDMKKWREYFDKNADVVKSIKNFVKELGI